VVCHRAAQLTALFLFALLISRPAIALTPEQVAGRERALKATVLILVANDKDELNDSGSGTILDAEQGYILTNYHVIGEKQTQRFYNREGEAVIGLMPPNLKGAPILKYRAVVIGGNATLDLAVLKITALFDDPQATLPQNLGLTAIKRADSDQLQIGDPLYVIGYPGLGGNTVTMSQGLVSGFLDQENDGVFEWIKTDAEVNHGNSGGLAVNSDWDFIGVPSAGVADVETVGKLSLIRTGNLALQFYDSVVLGRSQEQPNPQYSAQVSLVQFGASLNHDNEVSEPATQFPSALTNLYASLRFEGFRDGQQLTYIWYRDGKPMLNDAFAWKEGQRGHTWLSLYTAKGLADGFYELELLLDHDSLYRGGVTVGSAPRSACQFGPITFALQVNNAGKPVNSARVFDRVTLVYAIFPVSGMQNGTPWQAIWYLDGQKSLTKDLVWSQGAITSQWVSISQPKGLPTGKYRLEITCNGTVAQSGEFAIIDHSIPTADGINITGSVYDQDNRRVAISGALITFLRPGVSIDKWVNANYSQALVQASGISDASGAFQLDAKIAPGERYSIVVVYDAYEPIYEESYAIPANAADPYRLDIAMQRK
jgi:hypothetical protein